MKFTNIYKETEENLQLALLSLWAPGSHPMRSAIQQLFKEEPLLAEPVFQSTFGWETVTDKAWHSYLNSDVIKKLKIGVNRKTNNPQPPYIHQAESWKQLNNGNSIVVTSGTGSGKTECFMYPVLSDLYEHKGSNAVQAIFLYPLNALMEDQKERLASHCDNLGLKFAVYNGDTKEYRYDGDKFASEIKTRKEIRDEAEAGTRPQILLTNPSMLEYILVREKDQVMLNGSKEKLRWIVIDEAHSYSGSAAVELANQIKRILDAFGVKADDVRFACTSATIGGEDGAASLIKFIKNIIGQKEEKIKVIGGNRLVPEIGKTDLQPVLSANGLTVSAESVISLRKQVNEVQGITLQQLWQWLCPECIFETGKALELIDKLCELKVDEKNVMSLRAHFFMRSISGLYACANENCKHSTGTPFGHLTTYKAAICPDCGSPLLEIMQCKRCGSFILTGTENGNHQIFQCEEGITHDDYFALGDDLEQDDDDSNIETDDIFYIMPFDKEKYTNPLNAAYESTYDIVHDPKKGALLEQRTNNQGKWVYLTKDETHKYCPECGQLVKGVKHTNLKYFRIPISFINQVISPVFLKESAPEGRTWGKYIAFTDSRQGTAISAKTFNIDVERRIGRGKVLADLEKRSDSEIPEHLKAIWDTFTEIQKRALLASTNDSISLHELANLLYDEKLFEHISDKNGDKDAYKAALIRHFIGRRPMYELNAESMGIITLYYPGLSNATLTNSFKDLARKQNINISDDEGYWKKEWQNFLKICLDFYVRARNHIQPRISGEKNFVRDGFNSLPFCNDGRDDVDKWPQVKLDDNGEVCENQPRLILLLCAAFGINNTSDLTHNKKLINGILTDAHAYLVGMNILTTVKDRNGYATNDNKYLNCYYLDLSASSTVCEIKKVESAWECPVSHTLLDTLFCGYSPVMRGELSEGLFNRFKVTTEPITIDDDMLKECGLWSDRQKYARQDTPSYLAAEHSAQQSKTKLKEYTEMFKDKDYPKINVLHCSTTMEMGVDIGDIDIVIMDTIPPTAANYLQRVGRAGRMGQSKAIAFSLCNNTPVGQQAFANPMWALQTLNHMSPVRPSQAIIQRHINSFFFREFICGQGSGIMGTASVDDFMGATCDTFILFLDTMSVNAEEKKRFEKVFGTDTNYTIEKTKELISEIQKEFKNTISKLNDALIQFQSDPARTKAISNQINKCRRYNLLKYLSEQQFLPNASMPTGIVTFDFTDKNQANKLYRLYKTVDDLRNKVSQTSDLVVKYTLEEELHNKLSEIENIRRTSQATRDIRTALNEYAPEQTVVVNEKNYVSAGLLFFGAYNDATQTKAIYKCRKCGKVIYSVNRNLSTCDCGEPFYPLFNNQQGNYTLAYEPIGFRTDQNLNGTREENTAKRYYDIRPVLLETNWQSPMKDVNMCEVSTSGEQGEIMYYNAGDGHGFAYCIRCGRAAVEHLFNTRDLPSGVRLNHKPLWESSETCDANIGDIKRNVVFTGRHQTCYSVLRFKEESDSTTFAKDKELAYSMGVILRRALAQYLGIDENEIDFGTKEEGNAVLLFVFDTARGGCGYSLHLANPQELAEVWNIARELLSSYTCRCQEDGGACARCLVDRNNYHYAHLLSKEKVMTWLDKQNVKCKPVPARIQAVSPNAKNVFLPLKAIAKELVNSSETTEITFCVSDDAGNTTIRDWSSSRSEMGRLLKRAVELGKTIKLEVVYHPDIHKENVDKLPYVNIEQTFPDCKVELVKPNEIMPVLIAKDVAGKISHYFTCDADILSFSNYWGSGEGQVFCDKTMPTFVQEKKPELTSNSNEIIREGLAQVSSSRVDKFWSGVIKPCTLKPSDEELIASLIRGKRVSIYFSDMFVNCALSSLMLVYLIKEIRDIYDLTIRDIVLQLDSKKRKVCNEMFSDYTYINLNFDSKSEADNYTKDLMEAVLGITPEDSPYDAEHHRWLRFTTEDGDIFEIRPDHSIGGGWKSSSTYMNLDRLNGSVSAWRDNRDVLYYVVIKKRSDK